MPGFTLLALAGLLGAAPAAEARPAMTPTRTCVQRHVHVPAGKIAHRSAVQDCTRPPRVAPVVLHSSSQRAGLPVMTRLRP